MHVHFKTKELMLTMIIRLCIRMYKILRMYVNCVGTVGVSTCVYLCVGGCLCAQNNYLTHPHKDICMYVRIYACTYTL